MIALNDLRVIKVRKLADKDIDVTPKPYMIDTRVIRETRRERRIQRTHEGERENQEIIC